jgi:hypothetical protein
MKLYDYVYLSGLKKASEFDQMHLDCQENLCKQDTYSIS